MWVLGRDCLFVLFLQHTAQYWKLQYSWRGHLLPQGNYLCALWFISLYSPTTHTSNCISTPPKNLECPCAESKWQFLARCSWINISHPQKYLKLTQSLFRSQNYSLNFLPSTTGKTHAFHFEVKCMVLTAWSCVLSHPHVNNFWSITKLSIFFLPGYIFSVLSKFGGEEA